MKRVWLIALMLTALTSCGDAGKDSYYIEQHSFADPNLWDKVVLVFGYGDSNAIVCNDVIKAISVKGSDAPQPAKFRCVPAN